MNAQHRYSRLSITLAMLVIGGLAVANTSSGAGAPYPDHPLHLIVPYPQGGGADHWGRLVAAKLSESLGQQVIVDNIPGKGGNNGTAAAAGAAPDGYTLLLGSIGPLAVHQYTYSSLPYDPDKNFVPIALLESSPLLLVTSLDVQASSAAELIGLARSQPGQLSYASNGNGSPEQVAGEVFKRRLDVDIRHLPFDGAGPARKAVLAHQAAMMFDVCKAAMPAVRSGQERALAVAAPKRLAELPQVPTFAEIGVPRYELRVWTGVLAPAGTPAAIVAKLNRSIQDILKTPDVRKEITDEGGEAGATTPATFTAFIRAERSHWSALVNESGIPKVM
ncbi:MAG TPA: tripartite tricarboxylate transporter substrate-binding protein [Steroidobacteraceae bacterium]|jgi:tripartite-type tricarboxylate transporter receptor subunit TctC